MTTKQILHVSTEPTSAVTFSGVMGMSIREYAVIHITAAMLSDSETTEINKPALIKWVDELLAELKRTEK